MLLMMNSDWVPTTCQQNQALHFTDSHVTPEPTDEQHTCRASFQSASIHRDQTRVSSLSWLPDPNLEGTSRNVGAIECDINGVEPVLPGDEADGVFIWRSNQKDTVTTGSAAKARRNAPASPLPYRNTQTLFQLGNNTLLQSTRGAADLG